MGPRRAARRTLGDCHGHEPVAGGNRAVDHVPSRGSGFIGRADDITKVKGVLLAPTSIEEVVRGIPELSDEYEVLVVKKGDLDNITLKVELNPGRQSDDIDEIRARLVDQLRLKTNLGYNLEFHNYGSLPRYDVKAKRFRDLRGKE